VYIYLYIYVYIDVYIYICIYIRTHIYICNTPMKYDVGPSVRCWTARTGGGAGKKRILEGKASRGVPRKRRKIEERDANPAGVSGQAAAPEPFPYAVTKPHKAHALCAPASEE